MDHEKEWVPSRRKSRRPQRIPRSKEKKICSIDEQLIEERRKTNHYKGICKGLQDLLKTNQDIYNLEKELYNIEITELRDKTVEIEKEKEVWIGLTLKLEWLTKEIKKIGGLRESQDIVDCFDSIHIPEVPIQIRNKYVPTSLTGAEEGVRHILVEREEERPVIDETVIELDGIMMYVPTRQLDYFNTLQ